MIVLTDAGFDYVREFKFSGDSFFNVRRIVSLQSEPNKYSSVISVSESGLAMVVRHVSQLKIEAGVHCIPDILFTSPERVSVYTSNPLLMESMVISGLELSGMTTL